MVEAVSSLFTASSMNTAIKTGGAVLTVLLVIPALFKLFVVTVEEGSAAIRTRNGKPIVRRPARAPRDEPGELVVLRPGTHGAFPVLAWYRLVDVRVRSTDLAPRQLTGAAGHQHLVHASFDWRPIVTGADLRVLELDVVNVKERAGNIIGAGLRDIVHDLGGAVLPPNTVLGPMIVAACAERVRRRCGIELLTVDVTGDALTDGYLLSEALTATGDDRAHRALAAAWPAALERSAG